MEDGCCCMSGGNCATSNCDYEDWTCKPPSPPRECSKARCSERTQWGTNSGPGAMENMNMWEMEDGCCCSWDNCENDCDYQDYTCKTPAPPAPPSLPREYSKADCSERTQWGTNPGPGATENMDMWYMEDGCCCMSGGNCATSNGDYEDWTCKPPAPPPPCSKARCSERTQGGTNYGPGAMENMNMWEMEDGCCCSWDNCENDCDYQ